MAERLTAPGNDPSRDQIAAVAKHLVAGGVAVLPTDTIYGLHAVATDSDAIERLFNAKKRPAHQPLVVLCANLDQMRDLGVNADPRVLDALMRLWPAPLTAIVSIAAPIAASAGKNTLGVRIPAVGWLRELLAETSPLASTSVNVSGERAIYSTKEIPAELLSSVDIVLDAGELHGDSSTLVDVTKDPPAVLREGGFFFTQNLWKSVWKSL
ncbi:MAG TPA: L-threonylcarbamoyladenylate synthase [Thermoanaerobaculia bacterium]|nr:L-threonylcarbamoyladenylate synthase [Thermoanaerobaculia bacterium]